MYVRNYYLTLREYELFLDEVNIRIFIWKEI